MTNSSNVVYIEAGKNSGSGVILKTNGINIVITTQHLVCDSNTVNVWLPDTKYDSANCLVGTVSKVKLDYKSDVSDLAIIKIDKPLEESIGVTNCAFVEKEALITIFGYPKGKNNFKDNTVDYESSSGTIQYSGFVYLTDAMTLKGYSGGGVFYKDKYFVGIVIGRGSGKGVIVGNRWIKEICILEGYNLDIKTFCVKDQVKQEHLLLKKYILKDLENQIILLIRNTSIKVSSQKSKYTLEVLKNSFKEIENLFISNIQAYEKNKTAQQDKTSSEYQNLKKILNSVEYAMNKDFGSALEELETVNLVENSQQKALYKTIFGAIKITATVGYSSEGESVLKEAAKYKFPLGLAYNGLALQCLEKARIEINLQKGEAWSLYKKAINYLKLQKDIDSSMESSFRYTINIAYCKCIIFEWLINRKITKKEFLNKLKLLKISSFLGEFEESLKLINLFAFDSPIVHELSAEYFSLKGKFFESSFKKFMKIHCLYYEKSKGELVIAIREKFFGRSKTECKEKIFKNTMLSFMLKKYKNEIEEELDRLSQTE